MSKRRARRGSGSVYKHVDGRRWVGQTRRGGKTRRVYGATKSEAQAKLNALLTDTADITGGATGLTVAALLAEWLDRDIAGRGLAPGSVDNHRRHVKAWSAALGTARVDRLTVRDVEAALDRWAAADTARATLAKRLNVLAQGLDYAVVRDEAPRNVARLAKVPPKAKAAVRRNALTPDEARALLAVLPAERNGAMFAVGLRLGLRPGEAAALHWEDIDFDAGVLHVRRGVQIVGGRPTVVEALKTAASRRNLGFPADLAAELRRHRTDQAAERLAAERWEDEALVFASEVGTVLNPSNVRRQLARICSEAGITPVSPNELRHSCASYLSDQGVSHTLIADLLGHTTTRMVDATYRHRLRPTVKVPAVDWQREAR